MLEAAILPRRLDARAGGFDAAFANLLSAKREVAEDVDAVVAAILSDVAARGEVIYKARCASCHGATGEGSKEYAKPLTGEKSVGQLARLVEGLVLPRFGRDPGRV